MTASAPRDGRLGSLVRHSAIYGAAPFVRQFIALAMTRLYTDWLKRDGYGIKEAADLWMIALQQVLGQNVLSAMVRFYFDHEDERKRAAVVSSSTIAIAGVAWVTCALALLVRQDLGRWLLGPGGGVPASELVNIVTLVLVLVPFQLSSLAGFYYLQIQKRSGLYTGLQTGKLLFEVALNFWFLGYLGWGVRGFLISMLIGEALTSLLLTGGILLRIGPRFDWAVLRPLVAYALPLVPVGVCQLGIHQLDRRILIELEGQAQAGVYGLGYKIGYLVNLVMLGPFLQIWQPWIFSKAPGRERAELVSKVSTWAVIVIAAATLGAMLFGREAVVILDGDGNFRPAWRVIPFVASGYVLWALYQAAQIPLFLEKRTWPLFAVNLVALGANVGLNLWLVPRHGFVGAAIATCGTFLVLALLGGALARTAMDVHFEVARLARALVVVAAGATAALLVDGAHEAGELGLLVALASKAAVLVSLLGVLWRFVLIADERERLGAWVRSRARTGA